MQKLIQSKALRITLGIFLVSFGTFGGYAGIAHKDFGVVLMAVIIVWGGSSLLFLKKADHSS